MSWTTNPHDGTRLYYEAKGEGPALVLIMGLGGVIAGWGMQWPALTRDHRVIALDNRGSGQSDKPQSGYDSATMASDVEAVMDAEGVDEAMVLGVSMGGIIVQSLYHRAPNRISRLVLAATGPPVNSRDHVAPGRDVRAALERDRYTTATRALIEEMVPVLYHPQYRRRIPNLTDWLVTFEQSHGQPPHAYHGQLGAILDDRSTPDRAEDIRVPALIIHGCDDRVWPLANAHRLVERAPAGQLCVIEDAGHMVMLEQPRRFNAAVLEFTREGRG